MMNSKNKLIDLIKNLDEEEKQCLINILEKASKRGKIDELSIIQSPLKISLEEIKEKGFEVFQEMIYISISDIPLIKEYKSSKKIALPTNYLPLSSPLEKVLKDRSSKRNYSGEILSLQELSTLLHFSYGVRKYAPAYDTDKFPFRFVPSSGGLQSIELYLVINKVENIEKGLYHYNPLEEYIELIEEGNFRIKMPRLCVNQEFIGDASVVIILTGVLKRLIKKYGIRAYRYIHMDGGFVGENIYLVGTALNLGVCAIAGFFDDEIQDLLNIDGKNEFVIMLISVGKL